MNRNDFFARTMHTPDSPERAELRAALREDPDIVLVGELRDLETMEIAIETADNIAFAHWVANCGGTNEKGETQSCWMRVTACYRQVGGAWEIAHEHWSAPFDPMSPTTSPWRASIPAASRSLAKIHSTGSSVPTWNAMRTAYGSLPL